LPKDKNLSLENVIQQKQCFSRQLDLARLLDCPVIIHSRNSFKDCVYLIDQSGLKWEKVVFHCFSEGEPQMKEISIRGGRASFTGNITYPGNDKILEAVKYQGVEKLILETDSPYLSPEPDRKSKNEPCRAKQILGFLESIFEDDCQQMEEIIRMNTEEFFKLNS
jgi:TatD DNase family protein